MSNATMVRWGCGVMLAALILWAGPAAQTASAAAGDTVTVAASPVGNINNVIQGDTLVNGQRAHPGRAYRLYRDSIYYFNATINVNFPLTIFADTGSHRPPVIAPAILADNSSPSGFLNIYSGTRKLNVINIYFTGVRPDQKLVGYVNCMNYGSDSTTSIYRGDVFEGYGGAIEVNSGNHNNFHINDCVFMNLMHTTSWFKGEAFLSGGGFATDTVIIVNNTMFNCNSYAKASVDYTLYSRFDHNTVYLNCVNPLNDFVMTNATYRNNIFYGTEAMAQENSEIQQYYFENSISPSSTFSFDSLNTAPSHIPVAESNRHITVQNNSVFWPAKLKTFWTSALMDTLTPPVVLNYRTKGMFANHAFYPNFVFTGNDTTSDPGFSSGFASQLDSLIKYVTMTRMNTETTFLWYYIPSGHLFAPAWPLPMNLAYSNSAMQHAGTDGFALGDLNWFPSQKASWALTGVSATGAAEPEQYSLSQNYPNPFNPTTQIAYTIPRSSVVQLKVFNVLGQEVATLVNGTMVAGTHVVTFNPTGLASGVYFYRITAGDFASVKKMLLLK